MSCAGETCRWLFYPNINGEEYFQVVRLQSDSPCLRTRALITAPTSACAAAKSFLSLSFFCHGENDTRNIWVTSLHLSAKKRAARNASCFWRLWHKTADPTRKSLQRYTSKQLTNAMARVGRMESTGFTVHS